jgi:tRNA threonylcarbamoyladenosine biosynthesis protein TsaE
MEKEILIQQESEIIELGYRIGKLLKKNMVLALSGDLGAGKTTMTKGIGQAMGVKTTINSPTFTILKIHEGKLPLYHMDVYRLSPESGDDDLEEFFEKDGVCVIEWAENIAYLLPDSYLKIEITTLGETKRLVRMSSKDPKYIEIIESVIK